MHASDAWEHLRGLQPVSLIDWKGRHAAVLFFGGCNLRCPTCHNADLAWRPQIHPTIHKPDILAFIKKRRHWLDGLVVSGGEPTIIPDLARLLRELREYGLPVKLDTNGLRPHVVEALLSAGLIQEAYVDVKGPWAKYPELTGGGASAEEAEGCLSEIFALTKRFPRAFTFRTTKVPPLDDSDLAAVRAALPEGFELTVQDYIPPRRSNAQTDQEARRMPGDLVHGTDRRSHPQSPQGQRRQGPAPLQASGPQG
ncbi:anaerobic ribonucleoside-triphosphate reductase activating protein [Desulfohalovibrio reitneri]|uniref:anaerobic ribonucleoside-triphosphate reductase activating protein n=1 Tax=Desulfohalovibrio reitneri TaxID=1307759 RepID=UPI0009DF9F12|nr:anaerobic ribonucleoside-triphosphate reductase activating protein [Desulfohalovibrio reitneri]